jgi:hypothetical protein
MVDKVALGRVFFEYFGFPCQSSFHQILHHHNHPGQATIGKSVAAVPSGPSWTPPPTKRKKKQMARKVGHIASSRFLNIEISTLYVHSWPAFGSHTLLRNMQHVQTLRVFSVTGTETGPFSVVLDSVDRFQNFVTGFLLPSAQCEVGFPLVAPVLCLGLYTDRVPWDSEGKHNFKKSRGCNTANKCF